MGIPNKEALTKANEVDPSVIQISLKIIQYKHLFPMLSFLKSAGEKVDAFANFIKRNLAKLSEI